jgi:hypothetical protein
VPIEASRTLVEHLLGFFGLLLIESRMDGVRSARAFAKRLFEALLVELGDDVSGGLIVAPEDPGDLVGVLPSALASRIWQRRKVKASLAERRLAFKVSRSTSLKGRTKIGRFMPQRINYCLPSRLHMH